MLPISKFTAVTAASYLLAALALWGVMHFGLLASLFAGLLVFALVHLLAPLLAKKFSSARARLLAVAALSVVTVSLLTLAIWGTAAFFNSDAGSVETLLQKMADILEASRNQIPPWLAGHLPDNVHALREMLTAWLRQHATEARLAGQEAGRTAAHVLLGMIIGAMVALHDSTEAHASRPLALALRERALALSAAFRQIVFAQVRIAAINALLTAAYIFIVLPLAGVHLPLAKSIVAITFFAGLLPVVGNLVSNTVLVIAGLSHSLQIAVGSLLFMVVLHKLEYFLNAKIIGQQIKARPWELLIAMLVMEAIFGLPGVVAGPVYYAYLKQELVARGLI
ncbi:AI-2E family transporter [Noviherbaspirillum sedimenti]|uniref:AI-2E family transporter n=1 Tax=Noviherbaspirillum sedimenti TaxID=2320865 RepID=A0A3A3G2T5_9BURK|nr:AI-2E family transporter [Noviherbaspirillum sedimenti]RJG01139.1 AI-2E family transporter [Noviherbaspirillum sedimenti]